MILTALVAFIAMIVLVVAVHEWGHYLAARFFDVRVLRFSVGFGKPLLSKTDKAGTEWVVAPILLGGYVQLLDRKTARALQADERHTVEAQNNWRRFVIYAAGPLANVILAMAIYVAIALTGETGLAARIGTVASASPAAQAGLAAGDDIIRINGEATPLWRQAILAMVDAVLGDKAMVVETPDGTLTIPAGAAQAADVEGNLLASLGLYPDTSYITQTIDIVAKNSPAEAAGIISGDVIVAIDGEITDSWQGMAAALSARPGAVVSLLLWRNAAALTVTATLAAVPTAAKRIGRLGVTPLLNHAQLQSQLITVKLGVGAAVAAAAHKAAGDMARTWRFIGHVIGGRLSFQKNISGPVGIARGAGQAASAGWIVWWGFVALISISLAIVNLLPIPVLDGGQMTICVIQALIRRPLPEKLLIAADRVGLALLLLLMISAIAADLAKL